MNNELKQKIQGSTEYCATIKITGQKAIVISDRYFAIVFSVLENVNTHIFLI